VYVIDVENFMDDIINVYYPSIGLLFSYFSQQCVLTAVSA
jgi:hypothetical protein